MAANLVKAGHKVVGFDLVKTSLDQAKADGATIADSAAAAVKGADVVITMLPAGKHVVSVWSDIIPQVAKGALMIDCSTIDVESARQAHALAGKASVLSVDAPVSGGTGGAKGATLTFMAGGDAKAFASGKADSGSYGQEDRSLRRWRRGAGCEDLQQHDPRHFDDRGRRGFCAGRKTRVCRIRRCSTSHPPRRGNAGR